MSSLDVLDRSVKTAIAVELGERTADDPEVVKLGIDSTRMREVAGFSVVSNAARDAEMNENSAKLADSLMRFRADESLVRQKLAMQKAEPIAVVPATAWVKLCNRTKLFRFTPKGNSVRVSPAIMQEASQKVLKAEKPSAHVAYMKLLKVHLPIGILGIISGTAWAFNYLPYGGLGIVIFLVNIITWVNRAEKVSSGGHLTPRKEREAAMIRELVAGYTADGTLYEKLWPDFCEPKKKDGDLLVEIALPDPPSDVVEKLIRVERTRLPLQVAVVGEAIRLRQDVAEVFIQERTRQIEAIRAMPSRDPIIYVVEGSAVAVVAQFGDFPIEHEVMREVINSIALV